MQQICCLKPRPACTQVHCRYCSGWSCTSEQANTSTDLRENEHEVHKYNTADQCTGTNYVQRAPSPDAVLHSTLQAKAKLVDPVGQGTVGKLLCIQTVYVVTATGSPLRQDFLCCQCAVSSRPDYFGGSTCLRCMFRSQVNKI